MSAPFPFGLVVGWTCGALLWQIIKIAFHTAPNWDDAFASVFFGAGAITLYWLQLRFG